jgi:hypothetical protein
MTTITKMDRAAVRQINEQVEVALQMVADEFGLSLAQGNGKFDPHSGTFTPKWTFSTEAEEGVPSEWTAYCSRYGLTADDYDKTVVIRDRIYSLCGIAPRSPKYPILAKRISSGTVYKFDRYSIESGLYEAKQRELV